MIEIQLTGLVIGFIVGLITGTAISFCVGWSVDSSRSDRFSEGWYAGKEYGEHIMKNNKEDNGK